MNARNDARPIIIKRKKKGGDGGHHGGAWKVAYADFVTAMMAFFMLMWLLNATTEKQRKGIADYFSPTIPINRISGGGDGAFGGDNIFSENTLPQNGTGAILLQPTEANQSRGETGSLGEGDKDAQDEEKQFAQIEEKLFGFGGESTVLENQLKHINTRITDEGLLVELFAREGSPLFEPGTVTPTPLLLALAAHIEDAGRIVTNGVAIEAHVPARPIVVAQDDSWENSLDRATTMRTLLEDAGMDAARMLRVTGHADREPHAINPMSVRNSRLEIIFLRN